MPGRDSSPPVRSGQSTGAVRARQRCRARFGGPVDLWRSVAFSAADRASERLPQGLLEVLGRSVAYPPPDWNRPDLERLTRFHLHYGDEILGCARRGGDQYLEAAHAGIASWIHSNPPGPSDAWHPYPLST